MIDQPTLVPEWDGYDVTIWTPPPRPAPGYGEGKHDRDVRLPGWKPGTGTAESAISAGDRLGKPGKESDIVRRQKPRDHPIGQAEESVMGGTRLKETSPGRWAEDKAAADPECAR